MPRFHFNVYDGVSELDKDGAELSDWREARLEALRRMGTIFKDDIKMLSLGEEWRMEVTDDKGLVLFRLDLSVLLSPALAGSTWKQGDLA